MCYITNIIISKKSLLILIFFIFFIFPKIVYSGDILVGNIYEGEITNFKNKKINISLPPGKWKATKSEKAERQWWDAELINTEKARFRNPVIPNCKLILKIEASYIYGFHGSLLEALFGLGDQWSAAPHGWKKMQKKYYLKGLIEEIRRQFIVSVNVKTDGCILA